MAQLAAAAPFLALGGGILGAYGSIQQGKIDQANAAIRAGQLAENANAVEAASQREAIKAKREAKYLESRAQAVAAASGAGAADPTVQNIMDRIEAEGEYNALTALYNGKTRARDMRLEGAVALQEGENAVKSSRLNALTSVLSGASSFGMARYG